MKSSDLIRSLASELTPVHPGKTRNDMLLGLGLGAMVSLAVVIAIYGVQPGLVSVAHGGLMAMKACYVLSLAAIAGSMLMPMLRPGNLVPDRRSFFLLPVLLLAGGALWQTVTSDTGAASLWLGSNWPQCLLRIAILAVPILTGACWAIRPQAPLRLRATGALAGLVSGSIAAAMFALACPENGLGFVLVWYTVAIAISTVVGAMIGPSVLRW
ncbi:DUF1109 domain-containing protein [Bradyrhizobium sp. dw_411]|uniref:NrsF family protein n=1 Tax=Bradyrhizobium sp. dw_411 TaxID=2720082 RepID=UPI001BCBD790